MRDVPLPPVSLSIERTGGRLHKVPRHGSLKWGMERDLGDDSLSCEVAPEEVLNYPDLYRRFSTVVAWAEGEALWGGYLAGTPEPNEDGRYVLACRGFGTLLAGIFDPIFVQSQDLGPWTGVGGDPYNVPEGALNSDLTCYVTEVGSLHFVNKATGADGINGLAAVYPDVPITRFALTTLAQSPGGGSPHYFQIWQLTSYAPDKQYWYRQPGYDVALRPGAGVAYEQLYTHTHVKAGHPAAGVALGKPYDGIAFVMGGSTDGASGGVGGAKDVRLNSTITTADLWTPVDMLKYLADRLGWEAGGERTGLNLLPFYTQADQSWETIAEYSARSTAGTWRGRVNRTRRPRIELQVYPTDRRADRVWEISSTFPARIGVSPQGGGYDGVIVHWSDVVGNQRHTVVRNVERDFKTLGLHQDYPYSLRGEYPTSSPIPAQIGRMVLDGKGHPPYAGTITGAWVRRGNTWSPIWYVQPGDAVFVPEHEDNLVGGLYHVFNVEGSETGGRLTVGESAATLEQMLLQFERSVSRDPSRYS